MSQLAELGDEHHGGGLVERRQLRFERGQVALVAGSGDVDVVGLQRPATDRAGARGPFEFGQADADRFGPAGQPGPAAPDVVERLDGGALGRFEGGG